MKSKGKETGAPAGKRRVKKVKTLILCAMLAVTGGALLLKPERYSRRCFEGLCLWAECVLPSLFPFMVIMLIIMGTGVLRFAAKPFFKAARLLDVTPLCAPLFFMSACCGYPAGSRFVYGYRTSGLIGADDAKKLSVLCSICGPSFALGTVGFKAFGGGYAGVKLYLCSVLSVLLTFILYCLFRKKTNGKDRKTGKPNIENAGGRAAPLPSGDGALSAFSAAADACLNAGAFICFFYTAALIAADLKLLSLLELLLEPLFGNEVADALCGGLFEATGGCFLLAATDSFFALPLTGFLLTFGGLCILLQQLFYLGRCGVNGGFFIAFKLAQGVVCFALLCAV